MRSRAIRFVMCIALPLLAGCEADSMTSSQAPLPIDAELRRELEDFGVVPIGPRAVQPSAQVELGQALFFDKILSGNRDIACATCHQPARALGDGRSLPIGTGGTGLGPRRTLGAGRKFVPRNAPSLLNVGLGLTYLFWDGRLSASGSGGIETRGFTLPAGLRDPLAALAFLPVLNRREMRGQRGDTDVLGNVNELAQFAENERVKVWDAIMQRLLAIPAYVDMFRAAFPETPTSNLEFEHAARALAAFQKDAFTKVNSPFDQYLEHDDAALTRQQKRGALLFFGEAGCGRCHGGALLGGDSFANVANPQIGPGVGKQAPRDFGRGRFRDSRFYRFAFRVAPLRNVELTAPYTHSGAYATLEAVVRHYDDVQAAVRSYDVSQLDPAVRNMYHGDDETIAAVLDRLDDRLRVPLDLSDQEQQDLVAFLKSLTDPAARDLGSLIPATVPSGLPVAGAGSQ